MNDQSFQRLTDRDHELLFGLTRCVRLLSLRQISDHWFYGDDANARRRLKVLSQRRLVEKGTVRARSLPELTQPLIVWRPGEPDPPFAKIAYHCQSRWQEHPVRNCTAYWATPQALKQFGGATSRCATKQLQVTHDLGVAHIWIHFVQSSPEWSEAWRGEDVMAQTRFRQKLPDAFFVDVHENVVSVLEFGGSYDEQRIREFHADCQTRNLSYQLW